MYVRDGQTKFIIYHCFDYTECFLFIYIYIDMDNGLIKYDSIILSYEPTNRIYRTQLLYNK